MHFWFRLFSLSFIINCIITESPSEFVFHSMTLGHSGLLIYWETTTKNKKYPHVNFTFSEYNAKGLDMVHKFSENVSSLTGQHKIHSLQENTSYDIAVKQYSFDNEKNITYRLQTKTNSKTNAIPEKPDFDYISLPEKHGRIRWYPCGRERNCNGKEAGTHFVLLIKNLESKNDEYTVDERNNDYIDIPEFFVGVIFEMIVISINGYSTSKSDSQEVQRMPTYGPVRWLGVLSLPNFSILIFWKPPKYAEQLQQYNVYFEPETNYSRDPLLPPSIPIPRLFTLYKCHALFNQVIISDLKSDFMYTFYVAAQGISGFGFDYRVKYTLQHYKADLPIAEPDFNLRRIDDMTNDKTEFVLIEWLPCGQKFDCKYTRPGLAFLVNIEPQVENFHENQTIYMQQFGCYIAELKIGQSYNITVTSVDGPKYSKPVTVTKRVQGLKTVN